MANDANPDLVSLFNQGVQERDTPTLNEEELGSIYQTTPTAKLENLAKRTAEKEARLGRFNIETPEFNYDPSTDTHGIQALAAKYQAADILGVDKKALDSLDTVSAMEAAQKYSRDKQWVNNPELGMEQFRPETQFGVEEKHLQDTFLDETRRDIQRDKNAYVSNVQKGEEGTFENDVLNAVEARTADIYNSVIETLGEIEVSDDTFGSEFLNAMGDAFQMASLESSKWAKDSEAAYNRDSMARKEKMVLETAKAEWGKGNYFTAIGATLAHGLSPENLPTYLIENLPEIAFGATKGLSAIRASGLINDNINEAQQEYIKRNGVIATGTDALALNTFATLSGLADMFADRLVGKKVAENLTTIFKGVPNSVQESLHPIMARLGNVAHSGAGEYVAEASASALQDLAKFDTPDPVDAAFSGAIGLGSGAGTTAISQTAADVVKGDVKEIAKNVGRATKDAVKLRHASDEVKEEVDAGRARQSVLNQAYEEAATGQVSDETLNAAEEAMEDAEIANLELKSEKIDLLQEQERLENEGKSKEAKEVQREIDAIDVAIKENAQSVDTATKMLASTVEFEVVQTQEMMNEEVRIAEENLANSKHEEDRAELEQKLEEAKNGAAAVNAQVEIMTNGPEAVLSEERLDSIRNILKTSESFGSSKSHSGKGTKYNSENTSWFNGGNLSANSGTKEGNATLDSFIETVHKGDTSSKAKEILDKSLEVLDPSSGNKYTLENPTITEVQNQKISALRNANLVEAIEAAIADNDAVLLTKLKKEYDTIVNKVNEPAKSKNLTGRNRNAAKYNPHSLEVLAEIGKLFEGTKVSSNKQGVLGKRSRVIYGNYRDVRNQIFDTANSNKIEGASNRVRNAVGVSGTGTSKKSRKTVTTNEGRANRRSSNQGANNQGTGTTYVANNNERLNKALSRLKEAGDAARVKGSSFKQLSFTDPSSGADVTKFKLRVNKGEGKNDKPYIVGVNTDSADTNHVDQKIVDAVLDEYSKMQGGKNKLFGRKNKSATFSVLQVKNNSHDGKYQAGDIIIGFYEEVKHTGSNPKFGPLKEDNKRSNTEVHTTYRVLRGSKFISIDNSVHKDAYNASLDALNAKLKVYTADKNKAQEANKAALSKKKDIKSKMAEIGAKLTEALKGKTRGKTPESRLKNIEDAQKLLRDNGLLSKESTPEEFFEFINENFQRNLDSYNDKVAKLTASKLKRDSQKKEDPDLDAKIKELENIIARLDESIEVYRDFASNTLESRTVAKFPVQNSNNSSTKKSAIDSIFSVISNINAKIGKWILNKEAGSIEQNDAFLLDPITGVSHLIKQIEAKQDKPLTLEQKAGVYEFHKYAVAFHKVINTKGLSFAQSSNGMNVSGVLDLDKYPIGIFGTHLSGTKDEHGNRLTEPAQMSPSVTFALALSSFDWIDSLSLNTEEDLKGAMGVDKIDKNNPKHRKILEKYQGKVVGRKAARDIGAQVAKSLGLQMDPKAPNSYKEEIYTSLGIMALGALTELREFSSKNMGFIKKANVPIEQFRKDKADLLGDGKQAKNQVEIDAQKQVVMFSRTGTKVNDAIIDNLDILTDAFGTEASKRHPSTNPEDAVWITDKGPLKFGQLPAHTVAENLLKLPWKIDKDLAQLALSEGGRAKLFALFYSGDLNGIDLRDLQPSVINEIANQHSKDHRDQVKYEIAGILDEVDRIIAGLTHVAKQDNADFSKPVYLSYFSVGQGRFQVYSNTLDPQQSKIARKIMKPDTAAISEMHDNYPELGITKKDGEFAPDYFYDAIGTFLGLSEKNFGKEGEGAAEYRTFLQSVVENLGKDANRGALNQALADLKEAYTPDNIRAVADILNNAMQEVLQDSDFTPSTTRFKGMDAVTVAKDIDAYNSGDKFTSGIAVEVDSITSNFAISGLQYPVLSDMLTHLHRVGIFDSDTTAHEYLKEPENKDSYVAMSQHLGQELENYINSLPEKKRRELTSKFTNLQNPVAGNPVKGIVSEFITMLANFDNAEADPVGAEVSSAIREIFKFTFMPVNYLSGKAKAVEELKSAIRALIDKRFDDIIQDNHTAEDLVDAIDLFNKQFAALDIRYDMTTGSFTKGAANRSGKVKGKGKRLKRSFKSRSNKWGRRKSKKGSRKVNSEALINTERTPSEIKSTLRKASLKDIDSKVATFIDVMSNAVANTAFTILNDSLSKRRLVNSTFHFQYEIYMAALKDKINAIPVNERTVEKVQEALDSINTLRPHFEGPRSKDKNNPDLTRVYPAFKTRAVTTDAKVDTSRNYKGTSVTGVQVEFEFTGGQKSLTLPLNSREMEDVGVGSQALMVQAVESAAMVLTAQDSVEGVLHVHDAMKGHPTLLTEGGKSLNKDFYEESRDYHMVGDATNVLAKSIRAAHKQGLYGTDPKEKLTPEIAATIVAGIMKLRIDSPSTISFDMATYVDANNGDYMAAARAYLNDLNEVHQLSVEGRNYMFPHMENGKVVAGAIKVVDNFTGAVEGTAHTVDQSIPVKNVDLDTAVFGKPLEYSSIPDPANPDKFLSIREAAKSKFTTAKEVQKTPVDKSFSTAVDEQVALAVAKLKVFTQKTKSKVLLDTETSNQLATEFKAVVTKFNRQFVSTELGSGQTLQSFLKSNKNRRKYLNALLVHIGIDNTNPKLALYLNTTDLAKDIDFGSIFTEELQYDNPKGLAQDLNGELRKHFGVVPLSEKQLKEQVDLHGVIPHVTSDKDLNKSVYSKYKQDLYRLKRDIERLDYQIEKLSNGNISSKFFNKKDQLEQVRTALINYADLLTEKSNKDNLDLLLNDKGKSLDTVGDIAKFLTKLGKNHKDLVASALTGLKEYIDNLSDSAEIQRALNSLTDVNNSIEGVNTEGAKKLKLNIQKMITNLHLKARGDYLQSLVDQFAKDGAFEQLKQNVQNIKATLDRDVMVTAILASTDLNESQKTDLISTIETNVNLDNDIYGSSPDSITLEDVETILANDLTTYTGEITEKSVLDTYDATEVNDTGNSVSDAHNNHLRNLLSGLVARGLKRLGSVNLIQSRLSELETSGLYNPSSTTIVMNYGHYSGPIGMSGREVLAHELVHAVSEALFTDSTQLAIAINIRNDFLKNTTREQVVQALMNGETSTEARRMAEERYDYMFSNDSTVDGVPAGLAEFITFTLTNEGMVAITKKIKTTSAITNATKSETLASKLFNWILNSLSNLVDMFESRKPVRNTSVYNAIYNLVDQADNSLKEANKSVISTVAKPIFAGFNLVNKGQDYLNDMAASKLNAALDGTANHIITELKSIMRDADSTDVLSAAVVSRSLANAVFKLRKADPKQKEAYRKKVEIHLRLSGAGNITTYLSQLTEEVASVVGMVGIPADTTSNVRTIMQSLLPNSATYNYEALHRRQKHNVDSIATTKEEAAIEALKASETVKKSKKAREQITSLLLKSDISYLFEDADMDRMRKYIFNDAYRTATLDDIENDIHEVLAASPDVFNSIMAQADGLAAYMQNPAQGVANQLRSAEAIVEINPYNNKHLSNNKRAQVIGDNTVYLTDLIDKYVSLKSLDIAKNDPKNQSGMKALIAENANNSKYVETALRQAYAAEVYARENNFQGDDSILQVKGHLPFRSNTKLEQVVDTVSAGPYLKKQGYEVLFEDKGDGLVTYARRISYHGNIVMGMMSGLTEHSKGQSIIDHTIRNKPVSREDALISVWHEEIDKAFREQVLGEEVDRTNERRVPIYNNQGIIVDYNYANSNYANEQVLGQITDINEIIGAKIGTSHRKSAKKVDMEDIVDFVVKDFKDNYKKDPSAFTYINDNHLDKFGRENQYRDSYLMLSDDYAERFREHGINPKKGIPVRKSAIDALFGFKKMTIGESTPVAILQELLPNVPARKWAIAIDDFIKEVIPVRKAQIVLKTPKVVIGNFMSAFTLLALHGMNYDEIISEMRTGFKQINTYKTHIKELHTLDVELQSINDPKKRKEATQRYKELESLIKNLEILPLINNGMYSMMAEDVDVHSTGPIGDKVKEWRNENVVADVAGKVVDTAFVNKGTPMFELLSNLTQFTDFAGRFALYKHLNKQGKHNEKEIMQRVSNAFIYYDMPDGRTLEAANAYGVVMFSKFFIGIQRVLLTLAKENPANVATQALIEMSLFDIENILNQNPLSKNYGAMVHMPTDHVFEVLDPTIFRWFRALMGNSD